ncbi:uncharacterized protein A4U43_C04F22540 [Asparagus officinalis]|uniref:Late embryogenesis abundant protein LEA-2 subgroup domain-containing protein n=1 Tax=Asparagus officinalis TaxID=4686 RepID=A0A5P1F898_ASPOF|nr:NDR1/HIN1-like protein 1 [Asparagus officinalis]ONK72730.1 uncharacterized protein A4U43_C04F22540 [Asparagus officinalis]
MSLPTETSPKHCANKGFHLKSLRLNKKLLYTLIPTLLLVLLLLYFIRHPSKPQFYLQSTTISNLSLSSPLLLLLNSTVQATLLSKNPNKNFGVYYDDVRAYAIYKGQQITGDCFLPSFYQEHEELNVLSASMFGTGMPVAASVGFELGRDQVAGRFVLSVRVDGLLRWRVGGWTSGKYRFDVDCLAVVGLRQGVMGSVQGSSACSTNV